MILKEAQDPSPWPVLFEMLNALLLSANDLDKVKIQTLLKQILPTYSYSPLGFTPLVKKRNISLDIKGRA